MSKNLPRPSRVLRELRDTAASLHAAGLLPAADLARMQALCAPASPCAPPAPRPDKPPSLHAAGPLISTKGVCMQTQNLPRAFRLLLVGGVYNHEGGRPSGYFGKLATQVAAAFPQASAVVVNGGTYEQLAAQVAAVPEVTHLLWFADVPNELPKLLPVLKDKHPGMLLVASKNNRKGLYDRAALYARMRAAHSDLLVEFADGTGANEGKLVASVLTAQEGVALESASSIEAVAACLAHEFARIAGIEDTAVVA
jgi:hypothetical protein